MSTRNAGMAADGRLRLTYIHGRYPVLTETFIDREISALLDRGVDLRIVSIRPTDDQLSERQRELRRRVTYLLPASPLAVLRAHAWAVARKPQTFFTTLAWLLSRNHDGGPRYRTALHFVTGVYAAWRCRDRAGVHLHAHFADRAATVALVAARLLDTTYSVTAHATELYVRPVLLRERLGCAAFTVTCTEYNVRHLTTLLGEGIGRRLVRLYHGMELPPEEPIRARADAVDGPIRLLAVAQLTERKGLEYLVAACAALRERGRRVACEIVGDGPSREPLERLAGRLGVTDIVTFTGPLPHEEVLARYRSATAFVLPCVVTESGDRDGIPNVILEAMAASLPVISTAVSGIPEVVRDVETGLIVPERDAEAVASAIERLADDPDLAERLGSAGRALVRSEFDIERNVSRLVELFRSVAARPAPDGGRR